jgi:predicted RNA-binding Zn-ribbon protein involved in translation (DUF1610 family)
MAQIVSTQKINCPQCGAIAIVRIWSCGCQDISHGGHDSNCSYGGGIYFDDFEKECGEVGEQKTH